MQAEPSRTRPPPGLVQLRPAAPASHPPSASQAGISRRHQRACAAGRRGAFAAQNGDGRNLRRDWGGWGGAKRAELHVSPSRGQSQGTPSAAPAPAHAGNPSYAGRGRLPGVPGPRGRLRAAGRGALLPDTNALPDARPSASCPPHATPTGRRAPAPTSDRLRPLSRRPPQRAKPPATCDPSGHEEASIREALPSKRATHLPDGVFGG